MEGETKTEEQTEQQNIPPILEAVVPEILLEAPKPMGRPSDFSQELADKICAELAEGVSLRGVCKSEEMPCLSTVFSWLRTKPDFLQQYARAKEESADAMAEEIIDISDDGTNDWEEREIAGGRTIIALNTEAVQRSKLRVDTRKWIMSKMKPKKYGDKLDMTTNGKDIPAPLLNVIRNNDSNPQGSGPLQAN